MIYVAHVCRSSKQPEYIKKVVNGKEVKVKNPEYCDRIWIDKDLTGVKMSAPTWKYCEECCKRLGIDFDKQTPTSNLSKKQLESRKKLVKRLQEGKVKKLSEVVEEG